MTERKLATIRKIDNIEPIPGADKIVKATVGGWQLVTAVDNCFKIGDLVVYCEIDSWMPTEIAAFLSKGNEPREYNGVKGERLRTMKMRGQISQGLILPLSIAIEKFENSKYDEGQEFSEFFFPGNDVTDLLGIQKFEPEIPACLAGEVVGYFPIFMPKSDQERIQNLTIDFEQWKTQGLTWEETEKLEGASMTVFRRDDEFGVCTRNLQLKPNPDNSLWKIAIRENLEDVLRDAGNFALQGEIVGAGIEGNIYKFKDQKFYIYNIYDINNSCWLTPMERNQFITKYKLPHVPVIESAKVLDTHTVEDLLKNADAKAVLNAEQWREGVVYKCNELPISFKVISNVYLLGQA